MFINPIIKDCDVPRNLDLTALRAFLTVAETGGVTRAAGLLNLTQSAVSMQLKRLEEALNLSLLDRSGRGIALTPSGEQLLGYARRMLELNDEALGRLTANEYEGEIVLGVPHDIVYPVLPPILRQFATDFPRVQVKLISSFTSRMKAQFSRGEIDVLLTTEYDTPSDARCLCSIPLVWVGAPDGQAWKQRPLRLAHEGSCIFRSVTQRILDREDIPWEMALETDSARSSEATVSADLAVHSMLDGTWPQQLEPIDHGGTLPDLGVSNVNLYWSESRMPAVIAALAEMLTGGYGVMD